MNDTEIINTLQSAIAASDLPDQSNLIASAYKNGSAFFVAACHTAGASACESAPTVAEAIGKLRAALGGSATERAAKLRREAARLLGEAQALEGNQ